MAWNPTYRLEVLVYPETNKWAHANDASSTLIASSQKKITSFPSEDHKCEYFRISEGFANINITP